MPDDFEELVRSLFHWAISEGHELVREPAMRSYRPDFMTVDAAGHVHIFEVKTRAATVVFNTQTFVDVVPAIAAVPESTQRHWVDRLNVEQLVLLWAIAARLMVAHWNSPVDASVVTFLDILIGILVTRVIPPKE